MASAYSILKTVDEVQSPYNVEEITKMAMFQQQQYDIGQAKVSDAVSKIANLDLEKQQDRDYLASRLGTVIDGVNAAGVQNYGSTSVVNKILQNLNQSIDNNVLEAIDSSRRVRAVQSKIQAAMAANDGSYNLLNHAYSNTAISEYLNSDTITTSNTKFIEIPYQNYIDVEGKLDKEIKDLLEFRGEKDIDIIDENNPQLIIKKKIKNLNENEIRNLASKSLTYEDMQQLKINGWGAYGNTPPEAVIASYDIYYKKKLNSYAAEKLLLENSLPNSSDEQKESINKQISLIDSQVNAFREQAPNKMKLSDITTILARENVVEGLVEKYAFNPPSVTYRNNDAYFNYENLKINQQKLELEKQRMLMQSSGSGRSAGSSRGSSNSSDEEPNDRFITRNNNADSESKLGTSKARSLETIKNNNLEAEAAYNRVLENLDPAVKQEYTTALLEIADSIRSKNSSISDLEANMQALDQLSGDVTGKFRKDNSSLEIVKLLDAYSSAREAQLYSSNLFETALRDRMKIKESSYSDLFDSSITSLAKLTKGLMEDNNLNTKEAFLNKINSDPQFKKKVNNSLLAASLANALGDFSEESGADLIVDSSNRGEIILANSGFTGVRLDTNSLKELTAQQYSILQAKLAPFINQYNDANPDSPISVDDILVNDNSKLRLQGDTKFRVTRVFTKIPGLDNALYELLGGTAEGGGTRSGYTQAPTDLRSKNIKSNSESSFLAGALNEDDPVYTDIADALPRNQLLVANKDHKDYATLKALLESKKDNPVKDGIAITLEVVPGSDNVIIRQNYDTKEGLVIKGVRPEITLSMSELRENGITNLDFTFNPKQYELKRTVGKVYNIDSPMSSVVDEPYALGLEAEGYDIREISMGTAKGAVDVFKYHPAMTYRDNNFQVHVSPLGERVNKVLADPSKLSVKTINLTGNLGLEIYNKETGDILGRVNTMQKDGIRTKDYRVMKWMTIMDALMLLMPGDPNDAIDPTLENILKVYDNN